MNDERRTREWQGRIAELRHKARDGDLQSTTNLGHLLLEGLQVVHGRTLVRRKLGQGFELLLGAAECGHAPAYSLLGIAYDFGLGTPLTTRTKPSLAAVNALLTAANHDGDDPQAADLLLRLDRGDRRSVCACRRGLRPQLARLHCPVHGRTPEATRCAR